MNHRLFGVWNQMSSWNRNIPKVMRKNLWIHRSLTCQHPEFQKRNFFFDIEDRFSLKLQCSSLSSPSSRSTSFAQSVVQIKKLSFLFFLRWNPSSAKTAHLVIENGSSLDNQTQIFSRLPALFFLASVF